MLQLLFSNNKLNVQFHNITILLCVVSNKCSGEHNIYVLNMLKILLTPNF